MYYLGVFLVLNPVLIGYDLLKIRIPSKQNLVVVN